MYTSKYNILYRQNIDTLLLPENIDIPFIFSTQNLFLTLNITDRSSKQYNWNLNLPMSNYYETWGEN